MPKSDVPLPTDKHDLAAAEVIVSLGLVSEVLAQLPAILEWFQDINWPVARALMPLFRQAGPEVVPAMASVLDGDDDVHKYWVLQILLPILSESAKAGLAATVNRIAHTPTAGEVAEEVDLEARDFLESWPGIAG